jgi:hypothetical protein
MVYATLEAGTCKHRALSAYRIYEANACAHEGRGSTQQQARAAGFLYLLLALIAPIGLLYVPGKLIVSKNAMATADNIRASEWLLRVGIGSELIHQVIGSQGPPIWPAPSPP